MDFATLTTLIVLAVVILIVLGGFFLVSSRGRSRRTEEQRERTREEFGEEFDRVAEERGSEEEAEKELRRRRGRVERQVTPLDDDGRRRYEERWEEVERVFVENPPRSVEMADRTVSDLLSERNFAADAAEDEEETERSLAALYPDVAGDYREARRTRANIVARSVQDSEEGQESGGTEELRQAIGNYRSVFRRLVEG